jgi:hypothetical protein
MRPALSFVPGGGRKELVALQITLELTNTIRNVMIVVEVLMTSCQVASWMPEPRIHCSL